MDWIVPLVALVGGVSLTMVIAFAIGMYRSLAGECDDTRSLDRNVSARAALRKVTESDP